MKFIFCMQINIEYNHFGECNQACPKYPILHIFAISTLNNGGGRGGEVVFLPADKHKSFLQYGIPVSWYTSIVSLWE